MTLLLILVLSNAVGYKIDGSAPGLPYDGHGALSAGASSRLLWDYPETQRTEILDYLFKPNFGAQVHHLKVEIGGDTQSTDGTEPSHMHYRDDLNCTRGYEWWLMVEAKKRNPDILLFALSWGVPYWVGNQTGYYCDDNIDYHVKWLQCAKQQWGLEIDYIGNWNERSWGPISWTKDFRNAMDANGFSSTKIIIPDGGFNGQSDPLIQGLYNDPDFAKAVDGVGVHYPCNYPAPYIINDLHHKYWSSEDYSTEATWAGAGCWGRILNQNFVLMNQTSTIAWSLIWSVYPGMPYFGNGLMYAYEPWSGHYEVNGPIWTNAHHGQFTKAGWKILSVSSQGSGMLPGGGSYVTYVSPQSDFSIVIEKLQGDCLRCKGSKTTTETITFQLSGGLEKHTNLTFWSTNETNQFTKLSNIIPTNGIFNISVASDTIYTVSSLTGQSKGVTNIPASKAFSLPFTPNWNNLQVEAMAPYFADDGGSFLIALDGSTKVLRQFVTDQAGVNEWVHDTDPISLIGASLTDVKIAVDILIGKGGDQRNNIAQLTCGNDPTQQSWLIQSSDNTVRLKADLTSCMEVAQVSGLDANVYLNDCYDKFLLPGSPKVATPVQQNWTYNSAKQLVSAFNGQCLDVVGVSTSDGANIDTWTCVNQSNEKFDFNSNNGYLIAEHSQKCVSVYRSSIYAGVCGRIQPGQDFSRAGYCVYLAPTGDWRVFVASKTLGTGNVGTITDWHNIQLILNGTQIVVNLDQKTIFSVADTTYSTGFVSINSGWNIASFKNFALTNPKTTL